MKVEQRIQFSIRDVLDYKEAIGIIGGTDYVLPPQMPNIAYKQLQIPWNYEAPVILRKQKTEIVELLQVETLYTVRLEVSKIKTRGAKTFLEEQLTISNESGRILFISRSQLVTGGVHK